MTQLGFHYNRNEFACQCGCGFDTVDTELLNLLIRVRAKFNEPVHITSGCRCPAHNEAVGGSSKSQHKLGRAADIIVANTEPDDVADFLESVMKHGGIGRYSTFTHLDTRTSDYVVGWSG